MERTTKRTVLEAAKGIAAMRSPDYLLGVLIGMRTTMAAGEKQPPKAPRKGRKGRIPAEAAVS